MTTAPSDSPGSRGDPPPPNVAFLTMVVGRRVRVRVDAALAEHGLTYRHLSALGHLASGRDVSYADLARRSGVTTQSMQATLAQLQERGAVEQLNEAKRGLRAQLRVTPAGRALLEQGTSAVSAVDQQLMGALTTEQQRTLGPALMALFTSMLGDEADGRRATESTVRPGSSDGRSQGA